MVETGLAKKPTREAEDAKKTRKDAEEARSAAKETEDWVARQKLLQLSEISLVLDTYDDIFSDFDPRNYDHRSISDDFLSEIKRATREKKTGIIELHFLLPIELKRTETEALIKKRLREHFKKHYEQMRQEVYFTKRNGMLMVSTGVCISVLGSVFLHPLSGLPQTGAEFLRGILFFLAEPAAWFIIWTGFEQVFSNWKEFRPDLEFYKKMVKCEISFTGY